MSAAAETRSRLIGGYRERGIRAAPAAFAVAGWDVGGSANCLRPPDDRRWVRRT
jgi:hypothetical protein